MRKLLFACWLTGISLQSFSQVGMEALSLSRADAELLFRKHNVELLLSRLSIEEAEAEVIQAKLWPNPTLSVSEINLWANHNSERMPPLIRNWGQTAQVAIELEQLIQTAGKRRKLVAITQVEAEMANQYFYEVLRSLKVEFSSQLTELQTLQKQTEVYQDQLQHIRRLVSGYQQQYQQGHISQGSYLRLKAVEVDFRQTIYELQKARHEAQAQLLALMGLPNTQSLEINDSIPLPSTALIESLRLNTLIDTARANRPDLKIMRTSADLYDKKLAYEKAQRVPDLTLQANYDRGGNIMQDFVGIGLSVDLPLFNRNQGNIKAAQIGQQKSVAQLGATELLVAQQVQQAYLNLIASSQLMNSFDHEHAQLLKQQLESHHKNFAGRHIGLLEYIDFMGSYLETINQIFLTEKELHDHYEALQFQIGTHLE